MYSVLVVLYGFLPAILSSVVQGHAIAQLEARGHGIFSDPDHDELGAVASESAVCSKIGIELLERGGNAADAVRDHYNLQSSLDIANSHASSSLARFSALGSLVSRLRSETEMY